MADLQYEPIKIVFYSKWDSFHKWKKVLLKKNIKLYQWPDDFIKTKTYPKIYAALVWDPPTNMWLSFPKIKIIQSLGAGVDHIVSKPYPKEANIIKLEDPNLSSQMSEYVLMAILMCHRKFFQYSDNKIKKHWKQFPPTKNNEFNITILGYGTIAKFIIKKLKPLGFNIKVWSRKKRKLKNIQYYSGLNKLKVSINNSSCLISLLPSTPETNNIIGITEFKLLNRDSYFINVGRGNTVNENDLIYALTNSIISGAILDVFNKEPLHKSSKLWELNNVYLTPHIAGITNATNYAALQLRKNIDALSNNKKLKNKINNSRGY
jgi:glyoxylate/hydroxypyruvate reductase A